MSSLIPIGGLVLSGIAFFWDDIKKKFTRDTDAPPHAAVTQLIEFFTKKNYPSGVERAIDCGKQIYSAQAGEGQPSNKETK